MLFTNAFTQMDDDILESLGVYVTYQHGLDAAVVVSGRWSEGDVGNITPGSAASVSIPRTALATPPQPNDQFTYAGRVYAQIGAVAIEYERWYRVDLRYVGVAA